ncbi:Holliday junction branch migration protein RuvA [Flavipsychrobacter stenotrophus]|uniref:Holliday junction branch migration complex subunit RuvA n=1 Tax=Flavipsychrobacter stenotrophus TaxID=2077091 RepID=A0A2S7SW82_9BACT|nr:Holliday junction branch migration protein RuvA [Flavipsychrobacter stenotrophus]PQJ10994.1 Holliday junction branch migration protein RuvA [Flavipsychrobacter stenotrophus]
MYAFLEGELVYKSPSLLYLSAGGVGYEVNITLQTYSHIVNLEKCRLYTHLQVREDAWVLYGFADEEERATFRQLLNINGVGAATARIILSSLTTDELERAIFHEDAKTLEKVKGIGAKTAQRILLELKGKVLRQKDSTSLSAPKHNTIPEDALIALVNLGISKAMAENAIKKITNASSLTVEELIKQALRVL